MIQIKTSTQALLVLILLALIGYVALTFAFPVYFDKKHLLDYDIFYLVSTMIGEDNLREAYTQEIFLPRQAQVPGFSGSEMFWSYPPHFNLVVAPMSLLPLPVSYALFMIVTLAFYVMTIRVLAGPAFHTVAVLLLPLVLLIIRSGQNSFITGGLITLTCILALRQSRWAGLPLGLMAIKPHLALGVGIWSLLDRRWGLAALSLIVVAVLSLLATLAFSTDVWPTSLAAISATAEVLRDGRFPLFRMTSIYAFALSLAIPHPVAMMLHLTTVVAALGALIFMARAKLPPKVFMGAGVFVSALISPYNYDYDLALLGAAACLLFDTVTRHASKAEQCIFGIVIICTGAYGLILTAFADLILDNQSARPVSLMGPVLFISGIILFRVIWRSRHATQTSASLKIA
ncbi:hypothetical protein FHS72_003351 [Loktanella ponticola]|uniref:DUF2029 domain-containing protein n=1 Tax=Yoonia ponticola TaxID=1524255 RepID=A0A7W9BNL4_9RHOB|nr:glycosyltransferase family 87 protein [Yoonia ponticola]MBB5723706.1 hypothetical protein [Yoonia ponticola]